MQSYCKQHYLRSGHPLKYICTCSAALSMLRKSLDRCPCISQVGATTTLTARPDPAKNVGRNLPSFGQSHTVRNRNCTQITSLPRLCFSYSHVELLVTATPTSLLLLAAPSFQQNRMETANQRWCRSAGLMLVV